MNKKFEKRQIVVNGKVVEFRLVEICQICNGHAPVTKKAADTECVGHLNLRTKLNHW